MYWKQFLREASVCASVRTLLSTSSNPQDGQFGRIFWFSNLSAKIGGRTMGQFAHVSLHLQPTWPASYLVCKLLGPAQWVKCQEWWRSLFDLLRHWHLLNNSTWISTMIEIFMIVAFLVSLDINNTEFMQKIMLQNFCTSFIFISVSEPASSSNPSWRLCKVLLLSFKLILILS